MLIRLLIWLIVGFLIYTAYQAIRQTLAKPNGPSPEKSKQGEDMVQDPVCGTFIPRSDAVTTGSGDQTHYFCSTDCRDKFQNPQ